MSLRPSRDQTGQGFLDAERLEAHLLNLEDLGRMSDDILGAGPARDHGRAKLIARDLGQARIYDPVMASVSYFDQVDRLRASRRTLFTERGEGLGGGFDQGLLSASRMRSITRSTARSVSISRRSASSVG